MTEFETPNGTTTIEHVTGYKDDYKVEIAFDEPQDCWNPTNDQTFKWVELWFESEDYEFGDGYGRWMPWFYISMIALGKEDIAHDAYGKRGTDALDHFEDAITENADELIEKIEELKDEAN